MEEIFDLIDIIREHTGFKLLNQVKVLLKEGETYDIKDLHKNIEDLANLSADKSNYLNEIFLELNNLFRSVLLGYFAETSTIILKQINLILETVSLLNYVITREIEESYQNKRFYYKWFFGLSYSDLYGTIFLSISNQRLLINIPHHIKNGEILEEINKNNINFVLNHNKILKDHAIQKQWFKSFLKEYFLADNILKLANDLEKISEKEKVLNVNDIVEFRGAKIPGFEADILKEIELYSIEKFNQEMVFSIEKVICDFMWGVEEIAKIWKMNNEEKKIYQKNYAELKNQGSMNFITENNRISGLSLKDGVYKLPKAIGKLTALKELYINGPEDVPNILGNLKINKIPNSIGQLTLMEILVIAYTCIDGIPNSIENLTNLYHLNLEGNYMKNFPKSISNLENLKFLNLRYNEFSESPKSLEKLKSLVTLDMEASFDINIEMIIDLKGLNSIEYLNLGHNNITEIKNLKDLNQLKLINLLGNETEEIKGLENYSGRLII